MSQLILIFAALVAVLVLPVMFAARIVGADRTGFGTALLAVTIQIVLSGLLEEFAPDRMIAIAIAIIGGSAIYSFTLGTTLFRGFLISFIATVIGAVAVFLLTVSLAVIANAA